MPNFSDFFALVGFAFLMVASPGPANLVLIGVGSQHTYAKNLAFVFGLIIGKALLGVAIGLGFANVLTSNQTINLIFSLASSSYLIYLTLMSFKPKNKNSDAKAKLGFINGLILHPLNPKAWVMLVLAYSKFGIFFESLSLKILSIGLVFAVIQFVSASIYLTAGSLAKVYLEKNIWINRLFAIATIILVVYLLFD